MKAIVDENGVLIPKTMLVGVSQVEIRREDGVIIVTPCAPEGVAVDLAGLKTREECPDDPIWQWGSDPIVDDGVTDASVNHDRYLYGA